jgi:uncharacterized protein YjdB
VETLPTELVETDPPESSETAEPTEEIGVNTPPTDNTYQATATIETKPLTYPTSSSVSTDPTEDPTEKITVAIAQTAIDLSNKTQYTLYVKGTTTISYKVTNRVGKSLFTSTNSKIATVDSNGKITSHKAGKATIVITNNKVSKAITVIVKNPTLNVTSKSLKVGKSFQLKITGGIGTPKYSSNKSAVAKVSNSGKVTAKSKGNATITVATNGIKITCKVSVSKYNQQITLPQNEISKKVDAPNFNLGAKAKTALSYKSANSSIATVNKNGTVKVKKVGKVKITITAKGTKKYNSAKKVVTVEVVDKIAWENWFGRMFG